MSTDLQPQIVHADRLKDGIVITFDDGKCAVYSASVLYAAFPEADEVIEKDED